MAKIKAFKITQNNQYIQEINLNAGEYTFSANIRADSASITACKFSLLVGDVWLEYDLTDQIYIGQFQKVKKVIQLNDKATKLSLISSGSGGGRIFHVDRPMFEEGSNAGTPKPNELDIEEQAEASNVKVTIGIPYYEFRKDEDGGTVQESLTIPFHIFKGNVRVNVPSANIGTLYKPSNITVLDVVGAYNSVNVTILKEFTASGGRVVFSIPVDGRNYEAEFQFKVKEVKDGKSPYIGENGNWYVWDSAQNKYVDSGDPSHGDDGKSPEIRNGYWWVYENGEWSNTGIKAKGEDGTNGTDGENAKWLKLNSTATQIKVDKNNNSLPASISVFAQLYNMSGTAIWTYSVNGGSFVSTLPTGVNRSGNQVVINSSTSTFLVLTVKASMSGIEDTITITRVKDGQDGQRGLPGKSPATKEYRVGQTYYNNDVAIHYVYYRAGNSWWKLKDSVESHTASTSSPNTVYFEQLSSVEVMVAETIIAENANLAEFIFKDKTLFSQQGTNSAEDSLQLGEYVQLQFAQNTSTSTAPSSGWTDTPPTSVPGGQYLWMRTKVNSAVNWKPAERISGSGSLQAQWGALKNGVFYENWQAGRNWMRLNDGRIYALTEALAIADYKANLSLYGETGKIFARNIEVERFSIPFKTVTSLPEMLGTIRDGYSVYLNLPKQTVLHEWNVVSLPSAPSGTTISIRTNGTPKIKIKNLWDLKRHTMRNILLTYDINGIITLKHVGNGVWWIVEENLTIIGSEYPAIINAGERIYAGYRLGTSTTKYFSIYKENIALARVTGGSSVYTRIEIDSHRYYNTNGTLSYQTLAAQHFHLNVIAREIAMVRILSTAYDSVYNYFSYGVEFNKYRTATTLESYNVESAFNFEIFTNSDIVQSQYASTGDLTD